MNAFRSPLIEGDMDASRPIEGDMDALRPIEGEADISREGEAR